MERIPFEKDEVERSVPDRFRRIAEMFAGRTAVKSESLELTYSELDRLSNQAAQVILERSGIGREPVALFFDHDASILIAVLGVLKAGKAYVALDPSHPVERNRRILAELQSRLLLASSRNLELAGKLAQGLCPVLEVSQLAGSSSDENPVVELLPDALAGVFYTSGTTGNPKGVERSHRFILHRIWLESTSYQIGPDDRFSLVHNFNFGASVTDVFDALLNGASLCLYDLKGSGIAPLIPWLKEQRITFFHVPSDIFRQFLDLLGGEDYFPSLRQVTPSGRLFKQDVEKAFRHLPEDCLLIQRLASTETGLVTQLKIGRDTAIRSSVVPVGYTVADKEVLILGEEGQPLGSDRVGEIAVKSRYLASGYFGQPELTRQAFQPDPEGSDRRIYRLGDLGRMRPDGCLELVGRRDSQVKIRGFRVEPGEVEAALLELESVREAVVLARESGAGVKRLVAYVVPAGMPRPTHSRLRSALLERLPDYMVPAVFVFMEHLPLTSRNKVDLDALPTPGRDRPDLDKKYMPPRTATEETLAGIWSQVLNIEPVGIHDNFFELGGQSLMAARIVSRINADFDVDLPLRTLFDTPTISAAAAAIESAHRSPGRLDQDRLSDALRLLGYG